MVERTDDTNAGWAVAVIILLAVVAIGGFFWLRYHQVTPAVTPSSNGGDNINVTVPPTDQGQPPVNNSTINNNPAPSTGGDGTGNTGPAGSGSVTQPSQTPSPATY
jgi:hypothetical protein